MASQEPLKILSLDGGGIRGLSSLLILEHIMEKIRDENGLDHVPRPCEHFDLIGGTSTGGIIAIMLGRLRMTVDECIQAYRDLAKRAFSWESSPSSSRKFKQKVATIFTSKSTSDAPISSSSMFSARCLEDAIKSIVKTFCVEAECKSRRDQGQPTTRTCPHENMLFRDKTCTKTVVLAITKDNVNAPPTLFRTYDSSTAFESCTVWQVARATSAAIGFFDSIRLGRDEIEFVDATFGYNNPCEILIQEGQKQFPKRCQMRILSIGTGLGDVVTIGDSPASIISALRNMAVSSRRVARGLRDRFECDNQYFRFNVDQGLRDITLSDWEKASKVSAHTRNYLAENERAIKRFVDSLFGIASAGGNQRRPATPSGRTHFTVPFGRNKNFVGRESIMEQLLSTVPPGVDTDDCQRTAIVGLGGVGKTQVALEIAFRVREKHPDCSVFWVPAIDAVSFRNAYRNIGQLLEIDGINDDKADVEELVKQALSCESAGSWLLIVDNADNSDLFEGDTNLARHLPFSRKGSLLFTSRNHEVIVQLDVPAPNVYTVEGMSENEGFRFLETHLTEHLMSNRDDTAKLLEVLGYLPLALRQASAYMAKKKITTTRYLEYCRSSDKYMVELLSRDFEDSHRYREAQNPIVTTWLISFQQVADHDPLAADYLKFMCFLSQKAIPRSLLPPDAWTLEAEDAIGTLKAYAFITEREELDMYDIHRLVQLAMWNWLNKQGELDKWTEKVMRRMDDAFPFPHYDNKRDWLGYLPHARHALERQTTVDDVNVDLLCKVGISFRILGQYRESETIHRRELEEREKLQGPNHPATLISVNNLAGVLQEQGEYEKVEAMYRRVLEGREKVLGPDHPDTLSTVNNLGTVLQGQGEYEKAEAMYLRALEGQEEVLGPEHPQTLSRINNLGVVLECLGQYERAEAMYRRALEGREKVLGLDHPHTLSSVDNLGTVLQSRGEYEKAEAMHRRALEGYEKVLGPDHPDTLLTVSNLGTALQRRGDFEKAEVMYRRALEGDEKVLGPDHPDTLIIVNNLGDVLRTRGEYEKAEEMYRRALEAGEKVLGPNHPHTLFSIDNLGTVLQDQGEYEEAEAMYRRALEGREKVLGPDHPDTLLSVNNLGMVLQNRGEYEKAEAMYRRALEGREKVLGLDHPHTLSSVDNLGTVLQDQGEYEQAEAMYRRALEGRGKVLGSHHPQTLSSVNNLGMVLEYLGQSELAEAMYRRALEGREEVFGRDHPDTLTSVNNLGDVLRTRGEYEKAEAMYRRALEGGEKVLGPDHPHTLIYVSNMAFVLRSRGEYEKAEAMYRRALEAREKVLGPDHPHTLVSVNNLGMALECLGQYEKAEAMYRRALEGREEVLGPEHPQTLFSVDNLGIALECLGQYEMAEAMFRRALEGREKVLGPDHPDTLLSVNNLGDVLRLRGEYEKAEAMYRRALEGREEALGPDHPHTLVTVNNLVEILERQKKHEEAEALRLGVRKPSPS